MSNRLHANGIAEFPVPALDLVAVFSRDSCKVFRRAGVPHIPESWELLQEVPADTEYRSAAFTAPSIIRIVAGEANVLYANGVDAVIIERRGMRGQGAPGVLDATGTLTAAMIASGIVTSSTAAPTTATLDTGAVMDAALEMNVGEAFDWSVVNTGPDTFTVTAAASGHTVVGVGAVVTTRQGLFRTRKTAADTFVTYRLNP